MIRIILFVAQEFELILYIAGDIGHVRKCKEWIGIHIHIYAPHCENCGCLRLNIIKCQFSGVLALH